MDTIFAKIVKGEIPCYKVAENDDFLAFLDIFPLQRGHVLVIPKTSVDYLFDLDDELLGKMMIFAKQVAVKIKAEIPCKRIGVTVLGFDVAHAHIHLIPINKTDDLNFQNEKLKFTSEEFAATAAKISSR